VSDQLPEDIPDLTTTELYLAITDEGRRIADLQDEVRRHKRVRQDLLAEWAFRGHLDLTVIANGHTANR
jgi:hypothetical protein